MGSDLSALRLPSARRVWLVLAAPPLLFLLVIVGLSAYYGVVTRGDAAAIAARTSGTTTQILLAVQLLMLLLFFYVKRKERLSWPTLGWTVPTGGRGLREVALGAVVGAALAVLYLLWLAPLMTAAQRALGDYVPAGELLSALAGSLPAFFIANVLMAPFVEENLYRGYALTAFRARFGTPVGVVLSCAFFGLLHWTGGFWYVLLTGAVAGGVLAALFLWRGNLLAPFAAHLTLNLIEFAFVWRM